jgi:hypothetical protein
MKSKTNYQMASWIANFIKHSPLPPTPSPPAPIQPTGVYKNTTGEFIPF